MRHKHTKDALRAALPPPALTDAQKATKLERSDWLEFYNLQLQIDALMIRRDAMGRELTAKYAAPGDKNIDVGPEGALTRT